MYWTVMEMILTMLVFHICTFIAFSNKLRFSEFWKKQDKVISHTFNQIRCVRHPKQWHNTKPQDLSRKQFGV